MIDDSPIATGIVSAHDSITPRNESIRKPKPQKKLSCSEMKTLELWILRSRLV